MAGFHPAFLLQAGLGRSCLFLVSQRVLGNCKSKRQMEISAVSDNVSKIYSIELRWPRVTLSVCQALGVFESSGTTGVVKPKENLILNRKQQQKKKKKPVTNHLV